MLSIDPSSPFRGGALLGDRIRLTEHFLDPGVFIRSMATRGALGGLAEAALQAALLMDAAGKDDVFLETVGVGQAEVDVIDHADSVVLVLIPGSGDSIQALKAGVMEIPDVIVVNKSDHPLTDTMVREIRGVLSLGAAGRLAGADRQDRGAPRRGRRASSRRSSPSTARTSSPRGTLSERRRRNLHERGARAGHGAAAPRSGGVAGARTPRSRQLLDEVVARRLDPASAASAILARGAVEAGEAARPDQQAEAARTLRRHGQGGRRGGTTCPVARGAPAAAASRRRRAANPSRPGPVRAVRTAAGAEAAARTARRRPGAPSRRRPPNANAITSQRRAPAA